MPAKNSLQKYSGAMFFRGIVAILFAILALFWTQGTLSILVMLFGVFILFLPYASLIIITWLIGLYALVTGIALITFGSQIKRV